MFGVDRRICYSALLCLSFAFYGYTFFMVSTDLIDLQHLTNVSLTTASMYITYQYAGHLAGSVMTGFMFSRVNIHLYHVFILVSLSATLCGISWCGNFTTMATGHFFIGTFGGSIDSLAVGEIMRIWGSSTAVPMNSLCFAYTAGTLTVPFTFMPFLGTNYTTTNHTDDQWTNVTAVSLIHNDTMEEGYSDKRDVDLVVPYTVASALSLLLAFCLFAFYLDMRFRKGQMESSEKDFCNERPLGFRIILLIFTGLIFLFSYCLDVSFHSFLAVYGVTWMDWNKEKALLATSIFRGSMLLGRLIGIFVSIYVSPLKMLISCGCLVSLFLLAFIINGILVMSDSIVFVLCAMHGLLSGPINPCVVNVIEQRVIPVRGNIVAFLSVFTCFGIAANSPLIAFLMDNLSPMCFVYVLFVESFLLSITSICIIPLSKTCGYHNIKSIDDNVEQNNKTFKKLAKDIIFELYKVKDDQSNFRKLE